MIAYAGVGRLGTVTATSRAQATSNFQVYPNPFRASTTFSFNMAARGPVHIMLYNLLGSKVDDVLAEATMSEGTHSVAYTNTRLRPGLYYCVVKTAAGSFSRKVEVE